jgi:hypothetical protein
MAELDISGFDGAVALTGHGGDAYAWTLSAVQRKKDVSRYGNTRYAKSRGGVLDMSGVISVFLRQNAAGTAPATDALEVDGAALVLTAMTGCTFTGTAIIDFTMNHAFADPAIEGTYPYVFNGDVTEAWDETG